MWTIYTLIGVTLLSLVSFNDKYIIERKRVHPELFFFANTIVALLLATTVWTLGMGQLKNISLPLIASGVFISFALYIYFHTLAHVHVTVVTTFFQLTPLFVFVLSFFLLGETLTPIQLGAFFIVILAAIGIILSDHKDDTFSWRVSPRVLALLIAYNLLWSFSVIIISTVGESANFWDYVVYEGMGSGLVGLGILILFLIRKKALVYKLKADMKTYGMIAVNEGLLYLVGKYLLNYAYALHTASLVSLFESAQLIIALLIGFILGTWKPEIYKENISHKTLHKKIIYSAIIIGGLILTL